MKLVQIFVACFFVAVHGFGQQAIGDFKYLVSCQSGDSLECAVHYDTLQLTFTSSHLVISYYYPVADMGISRAIYPFQNDTVYYVDDSLEIAYYVLKADLLNKIPALQQPELVDSEAVVYNGVNCVYVESGNASVESGGATLTLSSWHATNAPSFPVNSIVVEGIVPILNSRHKYIPLRAELELSATGYAKELIFNLYDFSSSPSVALQDIDDGYRLKDMRTVH